MLGIVFLREKRPDLYTSPVVNKLLKVLTDPDTRRNTFKKIIEI
jgi:hypothetical protein